MLTILVITGCGWNRCLDTHAHTHAHCTHRWTRTHLTARVGVGTARGHRPRRHSLFGRVVIPCSPCPVPLSVPSGRRDRPTALTFGAGHDTTAAGVGRWSNQERLPTPPLRTGPAPAAADYGGAYGELPRSACAGSRGQRRRQTPPPDYSRLWRRKPDSGARIRLQPPQYAAIPGNAVRLMRCLLPAAARHCLTGAVVVY